MLSSDSNESIAICGELNIMNLVRATLLFPCECHVRGLNAVDVMIIVQINTCYVVSVLTPSDGIDSSGSFRELESSLAFSSQSAPLKNDRS
jgi:hypothetical protein